MFLEEPHSFRIHILTPSKSVRGISSEIYITRQNALVSTFLIPLPDISLASTRTVYECREKVPHIL